MTDAGAAAYVLAGDIGGTKTALALHAVSVGGATTLVREHTFASHDYRGLEQVRRSAQHPLPQPSLAQDLLESATQ